MDVDPFALFYPGCDALQGGDSIHPRVSERGFFPASSDAAILQLSFPVGARATTPFPPHLSCGGPGPFLRVLPTYTEARHYQQNQATRSPESFPLPVSDDRPTCLLAYECCRVKSKSFSRFLRCSLLQISSPPCFPSSPPSSCLFWVLVGCSEQEQAINRKGRYFFLSGGRKVTIFDGGYLLTHTGAGSESTGRFLTLVMGVSALSPRRLICGSEVKQYCTLVKTHQERRQTRLLNKDLSMLMRPPPPIPMCPQPSMETVCFHC